MSVLYCINLVKFETVIVGVPTRGAGSQLVNTACFLVPDDDARDNTVTHVFILVLGHGAVRPAKGVCEGTVLSCTGGACSRGYRRGERGREAPKSLLEKELIEASAKIGFQRSVCALLVVRSVVSYRMGRPP